MKRRFCFCICLSFALAAAAQQAIDYSQIKPKKVVHEIEVFSSGTLILPNDNGYSEYFHSTTNGQGTYKIGSKYGYMLGIGIKHYFRKRLGLGVRVSSDKRGLKEVTNTPNSKTSENESNSYFTGKIIGSYHVCNFYFLFGSYYSSLHKSSVKSIYSINGQSPQIGYYQGQPNENEFGIVAGAGYSRSISKNIICGFELIVGHPFTYTYHDTKYKVSMNYIDLLIALKYNRLNLLN